MSQPSFPSRPRSARPGGTRLKLLTSLLLGSTLLGGCSGGLTATAPIETGEIPRSERTIDPSYAVAAEERARPAEPPEAAEITRAAAKLAMKENSAYGAIAHLSKLAEQDPGDKRVAYDLARNLRYVGALSDAERTLNNARAIHPDDPLLRLELAKVKIAGGFAEEALTLLVPLAEERRDDPGVLQALGLAHDRLGAHDQAQAAYAQAMEHGRPSAALLNNDGLSRLMSGDVDGAVRRLREASTAPGANAQVRENLALALILKGEEEEAKRVAEAALPKGVAEKSLAYFRTIPNAQDAWGAAQQGGS